MDHVQEEIIEKIWFSCPFTLSRRSLHTDDHFQNLMNFALRICWTFCLCFTFITLIVLEISWLTKNRFIVKMSEIFVVWIDFTLIRFDRWVRSLRKLVASFYVESNDIFGIFLRQLLKICIQIIWICQMKRDSLVHNNLFHSLVTITGFVFFCWIQW